MKSILSKNLLLAAVAVIALAGATALVAGLSPGASRTPATPPSSNVAAQTAPQAAAPTAAQECMCAGAAQCEGCGCADCTEACCSAVPTCSNCADRPVCASGVCPVVE